MNEEQIKNVQEIIERTNNDKVKLFKSLEDLKSLVEYIEYIKNRGIDQNLKSKKLVIKVLQKEGEGFPDSPIYEVLENGFEFTLSNEKNFKFIKADKNEILVETDPLPNLPIEELGKGFRVKKD